MRAPEAGSRGPEPDQSWHDAYIAALEENGGQKVAAASKAGVDLKQVARHRETFPAFEERERDALKLQMSFAESEAIRRATEGVESTWRSVTKDGKEITHSERKFSDTLLLRLLTRLERGTWVESKQMEHSGGLTFKTRAERKAALEQARTALKQEPVTAINGRS